MKSPSVLLKRINRAGTYATFGRTAAREYAPAVMRGTGRATVHDQEEASPWRIGQNVVHPKFGAGVIVNAEGRGHDARVQVNFHRNGTKWLALEYAQAKRGLTL